MLCEAGDEVLGSEFLAAASDVRGLTTAIISCEYWRQNSASVSTWQQGSERTWLSVSHSPRHKSKSGIRIDAPRWRNNDALVTNEHTDFDAVAGWNVYLAVLCRIIRSIHRLSRPNIGGLDVRPSVGPYSVGPQKVFDSNELWYVDIGRWLIHDGMPRDLIQGQGQGQRDIISRVTSFATSSGTI